MNNEKKPAASEPAPEPPADALRREFQSAYHKAVKSSTIVEWARAADLARQWDNALASQSEQPVMPDDLIATYEKGFNDGKRASQSEQVAPPVEPTGFIAKYALTQLALGYPQMVCLVQTAKHSEPIYAAQPAPAAQSEPQADALSASAFDFMRHLHRQREWSARTFGPGPRTDGVCDHIRKELAEIQADPSDVTEWIDVAILALDGAWRAGATPKEIIETLVAKQTRNEGRKWPDWRTAPTDRAIEHDRSISEPGADHE